MTVLLETKELSVRFGSLLAVDCVSFQVNQGEVLGIVGESGSGKSVTLRALLQLVKPPGTVDGSVLWRGVELFSRTSEEMRRIRGAEIGMIFQEPMTALNPVLTIGRQLDETLAEHTALSRADRRARAIELLTVVGIPEAETRLRAYPHQFSGGMRQRAMISIALAAGPKLLLADEPTTALDVTIQDQILKLLLRLRRDLDMSVVLVTHDLGVVAETCDRVVVMYAGRIVETGPTAEVFARPRHAYTLGLLNSVAPSAARRRLTTIPGSPPSGGARQPGCVFAPRCAFAIDECQLASPPVRHLGADHLTACFRSEDLPMPATAA